MMRDLASIGSVSAQVAPRADPHAMRNQPGTGMTSSFSAWIFQRPARRGTAEGPPRGRLARLGAGSPPWCGQGCRRNVRLICAAAFVVEIGDRCRLRTGANCGLSCVGAFETLHRRRQDHAHRQCPDQERAGKERLRPPLSGPGRDEEMAAFTQAITRLTPLVRDPAPGKPPRYPLLPLRCCRDRLSAGSARRWG